MEAVDWIVVFAGFTVACIVMAVQSWLTISRQSKMIEKFAEEIRLRAALDRDPIAGRMQSQNAKPSDDAELGKVMATMIKRQQEQRRAAVDRAGTVPPKPRKFSRRLSPADQPIRTSDDGSNTGAPAADGK